MGIPFVFEFISSLAERGSYGDVSWYWAVFDMINFFQGVFIFLIFVFKDEMRKQLAEQYSSFQCKFRRALIVLENMELALIFWNPRFSPSTRNTIGTCDVKRNKFYESRQ